MTDWLAAISLQAWPLLRASPLAQRRPKSILTKSIRPTDQLIVPFVPDHRVDVLHAWCRNTRLGLSQTVIVENRPGAGSSTGTKLVATSAPTVYTLLMAASRHLSQSVSIPSAFDAVKAFWRSQRLQLVSRHGGGTAVPARSVAEIRGTCARQSAK